jgi:hypothetical protein
MGPGDYIIDVLSQIAGGRGDPGNNVVRFLLPAIFFGTLLFASFRQWRKSGERRDFIVATASLIGLFRELFMFVIETGNWLGFLPHKLTHSYFPHFEHILSIFAETLIVYAFIRFYQKERRYPDIFLVTVSIILVGLYLLAAPGWASYLAEHPDAKFGEFMADLAFHITASLGLFFGISVLTSLRKNGMSIPLLLIGGFLFFFLDESLMIVNLLQSEIYREVYGPIRHNLHIWAVPMFLYVYWRELKKEIRELGKARDIAFELSPDLLIIADMDGRIIQASPASLEIFGLPPHSLTGSNIRSYGFPEDLLKEIVEVKESGTSIRETEIRIRNPHAGLIWTKWRIKPVPAEGIVYIVIMDITSEKINRESLRLLEQINTAILAGVPLREVLENAAILSREIFGYSAFNIYLFDEETGELRPVASALEGSLMKRIEGVIGNNLGEYTIPIREGNSFYEVIKKGKTVVTEDIEGALEEFSDIEEIRSLAREAGRKSEFFRIIRLPLRVDDRIIGLLGAARDCSISGADRKMFELFSSQLGMAIKNGRLEEQLRESERRFREVLEQNDEAVIIIDAETGRIVYANRAAGEITGIPLKELLGGTSGSVQELTGGPPPFEGVEVSGLTVRLNGDLRPETRLTVKRKRIRSGRQKLLIVTCRDVTEEYLMEKKRHEFQARLIQTNKMTSLGLLVSGVAHEVNNPNNFILTNARLLEDIWPDIFKILSEYREDNGDFSISGIPFEELRHTLPELISGITEGSRRIRSIIENLKGLARSNAGKFSSTDLNRAVLNAVTILRTEINRHTEHFTFSLHPDLHPVTGNEQQIEQVVINLLMNALQALPSRDRGVSLATSVRREEKNAIIEIRDEGRGIPPEILERLGEPFLTTRHESGGTGLGVSISRTIVSEHGGEIRFSSSPGKGTTVEVLLPFSEVKKE